LAPSQALRDAWTAVDERIEAGDIAGAVELELRMWVDGPGRTPEEVDRSVRERVREMDAALFAQPDEGEPQPLDPPAAARLHEVAVPTLVLVGHRDQPDVLAGAETLAAGIPGARRAVIPNTAHLPNLERPAEFNRLVLEFLAGLDPS
ncbi:MAG: alpha/beta hydrolase, partial [Chloroflexota bacterium]|nr:alpha/beta hydrolase [Chloroflexota bacterium]